MDVPLSAAGFCHVFLLWFLVNNGALADCGVLLNEPSSMRKKRFYPLAKGFSWVVLAIFPPSLCLKDRDEFLGWPGLVVRWDKSEKETLDESEMREEEGTSKRNLFTSPPPFVLRACGQLDKGMLAPTVPSGEGFPSCHFPAPQPWSPSP